MKQTIIYLRTSTDEQNPENQRKDCESFAKELGFVDYDVLIEQGSAYKDNDKREVFEEIRQNIIRGFVKNLIVWDLDRLYRNREKTMSIVRDYSRLGLRVFSFRQKWLLEIQKAPAPFNEMFYDLFVHVFAWISEDESLRKSMRIKSAIRIVNGKKVSYKGNPWGKQPLPDKIINEVMSLHKDGLSVRNIAKQVYYYRGTNKKYLSAGYVHKIVSRFKAENSLQNEKQQEASQ